MDTKQFDDAVSRAKRLAAQPNDTLLELYGLFKQASVGDVTGKRPGRLDFKGRAKHDAWAARKGMSQEAAMQAYVAKVDALS